MLTKGDWLMIAQGKRDGKYLKDNAEELGVHPRTVRRALDRGGPGNRLKLFEILAEGRGRE